MNKLTLIGNLTADPERRATPSGKTVTTFTVAVSRRFAVNGEKVTDFFRISAWGQIGENCAKYLAKGRKVAVVGELQARMYEGRNGSRMSLDVQADEVEFLSPADRQENQQASSNDTNAWDDISSADLPWGD